MIDGLFLGAIIGSGMVLEEESARQTRILAQMQNQMISDYHSNAKIPARTKHQIDLIDKASKAFKDKDYKLALFYAERLLKLQDSDALYYLLRGDCFVRLGKILDAIENYDKALDLSQLNGSLPKSITSKLTRAMKELEKMQSKIITSGNDYTDQDITKMIDEFTTRQEEAFRIEERKNEERLRKEKIHRFVRAIPSKEEAEVAVVKYLKSTHKPRNPEELIKEINGEDARNSLDRMILYRICLTNLIYKKMEGYFVRFCVYEHNCKGVNGDSPLFINFKYMNKAVNWEYSSDLLYYKAVNLISDLKYYAHNKKGYPEKNPIKLAQLTEILFLCATADSKYVVTVITGKTDS